VYISETLYFSVCIASVRHVTSIINCYSSDNYNLLMLNEYFELLLLTSPISSHKKAVNGNVTVGC